LIRTEQFLSINNGLAPAAAEWLVFGLMLHKYHDGRQSNISSTFWFRSRNPSEPYDSFIAALMGVRETLRPKSAQAFAYSGVFLEFSTTRELSIRRKMGRSRSSRTAAAVSGEPRCPRNDHPTD
jgi:hypothetical protein